MPPVYAPGNSSIYQSFRSPEFAGKLGPRFVADFQIVSRVERTKSILYSYSYNINPL